MEIERRDLVRHVTDQFYPDDGDPMDAAVDAMDRFTQSMSRSISRRLAHAVLALIGSRSIEVDGANISTLAKGNDVFVVHVTAWNVSGRRTISCWRTPSADAETDHVISMGIEQTQSGFRVERWDTIRNWSALLDLSAALDPHAFQSPTDGYAGTFCDRLVEADGGLPGDGVRAALNVVAGRVVIAAASDLREVHKGLVDLIAPTDTIKLGNGWTALRIGPSLEDIGFSRTNGGGFVVSAEQTGRFLVSSADGWIEIDEEKHLVNYSAPPTTESLFSMMDAIGRGAGYLCLDRKNDLPSPGM